MTDKTNRITFVTGNKKKLEEVVAILGSSCPFVLDPLKVDLPELQGEPEVVAREKCKLAALQSYGFSFMCACDRQKLMSHLHMQWLCFC